LRAGSNAITSESASQSLSVVAILHDPEESASQSGQILKGAVVITTLISVFMTVWSYLIFAGLNSRPLLHPLTLFTTYYGLTTLRVMVLNSKFAKPLLSYHLNTSEGFHFEQDSDDTGNIYAGKSPAFNMFRLDTPPLYVLSIARPSIVFKLMIEAQEKLQRPA
jgi:hypothetical protein